MKKDRIFILFYFLILAVHIYAGEVGWTIGAAVTKPALISSLIIFFTVNVVRSGFSSFSGWLLGGLVLSLFGDVFLMFQERDSFFIYGLGSFLVAHAFYIGAFTKTYIENHEIRLLKKHGWVMILVVAYAFYFFSRIKEYLGEMMGPVLIYTMVLSLMALIAFNRYRKVSPTSFFCIAFGAILFIASDSLLAWNKFVEDLRFSHTLIMLSYGLAQLFITYGAVIQVRITGSNR